MLGRTIRLAGGEDVSLIPARWYTRIFVTADITTLVIQGTGTSCLHCHPCLRACLESIYTMYIAQTQPNCTYLQSPRTKTRSLHYTRGKHNGHHATRPRNCRPENRSRRSRHPGRYVCCLPHGVDRFPDPNEQKTQTSSSFDRCGAKQ